MPAVKIRPPSEPAETTLPAQKARATGRRFLYALVGALAVHALLVLALSRAPKPPPRAAPSRVAVELRFAETVKPPTETPKAAPRPAAPLSARASRASEVHPSASPQPSAGASGAASPTAAPPPPSANVPHDEAWLRAEGLGPAQKPLQFGLVKTLKDPLAALGPSAQGDRPGAGTWNNGYGQGPQGPVRVPSREEALAEEKTRVEGMVQGWIADDQAFARARDDRDGYWQDVQDQLEKGFAPGWALLDDRPGNSTSAVPHGLRALATDYSAAAGNYGKSGSPIAPGQKAPGVPSKTLNDDLLTALPGDRGLSGTPMDNNMAAVHQMQNGGGGMANNSSGTQLIAHVLLTQRPDGVLDDVTLAGSSGNPAYDALALTQARTLGKRGMLGAPPKDRRRTLWAFVADFKRGSLLPSCGLDVNFLPAECSYPAKKMNVHSRVKLEAVY